MAVACASTGASPSGRETEEPKPPANASNLLQNVSRLQNGTFPDKQCPFLAKWKAGRDSNEAREVPSCPEDEEGQDTAGHAPALDAGGRFPVTNGSPEAIGEAIDAAIDSFYCMVSQDTPQWDAGEKGVSDENGIWALEESLSQYCPHRPQSQEDLGLSFSLEPKRGRMLISKNRCPVCFAMFSRVLDLEEHGRQTKHGVFRCKVCQRGFTRQDALTRHRRVHESPGSRKQYPCTLCKKYDGSKAFRRRDHLRQHLRKMHRLDPDTKESSIMPDTWQDWQEPMALTAYDSVVGCH